MAQKMGFAPCCCTYKRSKKRVKIPPKLSFGGLKNHFFLGRGHWLGKSCGTTHEPNSWCLSPVKLRYDWFSNVQVVSIWFLSFTLKSPIHGPKILVFWGAWLLKFWGTSFRPPECTSLRAQPSMWLRGISTQPHWGLCTRWNGEFWAFVGPHRERAARIVLCTPICENLGKFGGLQLPGFARKYQWYISLIYIMTVSWYFQAKIWYFWYFRYFQNINLYYYYLLTFLIHAYLTL